MNEFTIKIILIFLFSFIIYLFKLNSIENCLFRINSDNQTKLNLGALYSGLYGPIKTLYLSYKYNDIKTTIKIFNQLFLTMSNPIFILLFVSFLVFQF